MMRLFSVFLLLIFAAFVGLPQGNVPPLGGGDLDSLRLLARPSFEFEQAQLNHDTLLIVSSSRFFYYPFGSHQTIAGFKHATQSFFSSHAELFRDPHDSTGPTITLYRFSSGRSFLKCYLSDPPGSTKAVEIVSGRFVDPRIRFTNGIRIGMTDVDFLRTFFSSFPATLLSRCRVFEIESAVAGIWHYYRFTDGKLESIVLDTDYQFPKE